LIALGGINKKNSQKILDNPHLDGIAIMSAVEGIKDI